MKRHPLFIKYTRGWLHQATGYSRGYLSRVATGAMPLSCLFIKRVCLKLNEPEAELFLPDSTQPAQGSRGCTASKVGQWLQQRCKAEHLPLRQAAVKTGLSHSTIDNIIKGNHPQPETIMKLAKAFTDGPEQSVALGDHLLALAGYQTEQHPEGTRILTRR